MRIAVLMGGLSVEREVSLASGAQVARALREAGHEAIGVDTGRGVLSAAEESAILSSGVGNPGPLEDVVDMLRTGDLSLLTRSPELAGVEIIFPALHGGRGEDGTLQALLEISGIPFVGSDRVGCALAMDKDLSKRLLRDAGVPTPDWILAKGRAEGEAGLSGVVDRLGFPLIVKPPSGGSTLGLTLAHDMEELRNALDLALQYEEHVMFEGYVQGREVTVGVVGNETLAVGEIIPEHELFDYECKYKPGMAQEIFPADLPKELSDSLQTWAMVAHETLRMRDFSRVDFILTPDGTPWCLEANALPGFTANSLLPKAARATGISFPDLCHSLVLMAAERGLSVPT